MTDNVLTALSQTRPGSLGRPPPKCSRFIAASMSPARSASSRASASGISTRVSLYAGSATRSSNTVFRSSSRARKGPVPITGRPKASGRERKNSQNTSCTWAIGAGSSTSTLLPGPTEKRVLAKYRAYAHFMPNMSRASRIAARKASTSFWTAWPTVVEHWPDRASETASGDRPLTTSTGRTGRVPTRPFRQDSSGSSTSDRSVRTPTSSVTRVSGRKATRSSAMRRLAIGDLAGFPDGAGSSSRPTRRRSC